MQLPVGASDSELEQRIIQPLEAVAAIRSTHHRIHSSREEEGGGGGGQRHTGPFVIFSSGRGVPEANPPGHSFGNR